MSVWDWVQLPVQLYGVWLIGWVWPGKFLRWVQRKDHGETYSRP